jgi:hypothetical protein
MAKGNQTPKDTMSYCRGQFETLDKQIIDLPGQRMTAARGIYKLDHQKKNYVTIRLVYILY